MSIGRWLYVHRPVDYSPDVLFARELDYILHEMGERTPPDIYHNENEVNG